jgi:hypothetical protein
VNANVHYRTDGTAQSNMRVRRGLRAYREHCAPAGDRQLPVRRLQRHARDVEYSLGACLQIRRRFGTASGQRNYGRSAELTEMRPKLFDDMIVSLGTPEHVALWVNEFGVPYEAIRAAIQKVGPRFNDIRDELGMARVYIFPRWSDDEWSPADQFK